MSLSWIKKSARGRTRLVRLSEGSRWDVRGAHLRHDRGVHVGVDGVIGVNLRRRRGRRVVGRAVVRSLPGEARTDRIELVRKGGGFPRSEGGARNGGYPRRCARPVPREWASTGWIQRSMVPATHLFAPRMSSGSPPPFFAAFPMDALDSRSNKELKGIKRKSGVGKCPPGPRCDASRLLRARDKSNARALCTRRSPRERRPPVVHSTVPADPSGDRSFPIKRTAFAASLSLRRVFPENGEESSFVSRDSRSMS